MGCKRHGILPANGRPVARPVRVGQRRQCVHHHEITDCFCVSRRRRVESSLGDAAKKRVDIRGHQIRVACSLEPSPALPAHTPTVENVFACRARIALNKHTHVLQVFSGMQSQGLSLEHALALVRVCMCNDHVFIAVNAQTGSPLENPEFLVG